MVKKHSTLLLVCVLSLLVPSSHFSLIFGDNLANDKETVQPNKLIATEFDETIVDTALYLDGNESYVEIIDSETINNIREQVTVSLWIKPTDFPRRYTNVLFKGNNRMPGITHRQFTLWLFDNGSVQFDTSPGGQQAQYLVSRSNSIKLNQWSHVAAIIDVKKDEMKLYINGIEVERDNFDNERHILETRLPLRIGSSHEEEMPFHASFVGQIDEVRVWNIVRSEADIRSDMTTKLNGDEPGLVGYWKFDEDKDGVVADVSPNRNDGNLVGNAKLIDYVRPVSAITGPDQLEKVASAYEKLLTRNTNFYDAFRYLAEIYIKTKLFSDAEKVYIRALKADLTQSEHNDAILALRKLYTDREAGEEFITLLEELKPKMEGSSVLHELLGDVYKNAGEEEKAQLAYTQWINIRKKEVELQNRASEYHILAEKLLTKDLFPEVALELAMNASDNEPRSSYDITLAHALLVNELYEVASQVIGSNLDIRLHPTNALRWFSRIVKVGKNVKDKDGYAKMLEDLIDIIPHNLSAHFNLIFALAQFYKENDMPEKAEELIQKTGFVMEDAWMVLGPFDNVGGIGFRTEYIPEKLPRVDTTAKYDGKNGQVTWRKYTDEILNGYIRIGDSGNRAVGYAFATVNSPDEREVDFIFDSSDQSKIWLNGIEIFARSNSFTPNFDNYSIPVTLNAGKNSILIKVSEQPPGWGFYLQVTDTEGNPFEDLKLSGQGEN